MGFGIVMKKCGMWDFCEKGAGMRDHHPPLETLVQENSRKSHLSLVKSLPCVVFLLQMSQFFHCLESYPKGCTPK